MSLTENALHRAKKSITMTSNLSNTWEDALQRVKWVMDTVNPVAEVRFCFVLPILD
jgi:hypothetical protein